MQIKVHKPADSDSGKVGALAYTSMLSAFKEAGWPIPANASPDIFAQMWAAGRLVVIGAWEGDQMLGCRTMVLSNSVFSAAAKIASTLTLLVAPEHRRQGIGTQLVTQGDAWARSQGAWGVTISATPASESLFRQVGYGPHSVALGRLLA